MHRVQSVRKTGKSFTTFLIDLSPSMAKKRVIQEEITNPANPAENIFVQRELTTLEWVLELPVTKVGQMVRVLISFSFGRFFEFGVDCLPGVRNADLYRGRRS